LENGRADERVSRRQASERALCVYEAVSYSTTPSQTRLLLHLDDDVFCMFLQKQKSETYTVRRDSPAREPSLSALWLQKPSILSVCVREEDTGGRETVVPSRSGQTPGQIGCAVTSLM
jgi:hypothetical protein